MDLCAGSNGDADTQNRRVDTVGGIGRGGWGEGGADGARRTNAYTPSSVKHSELGGCCLTLGT